MKIALCFYGQPRLLEEGYENITKFINNNSDISFDIFYHTWYAPTDIPTYYKVSPWRNIPLNTILMDNNILNKINKLYKPIDFCYDAPINFNISNYDKTKAFNNSDNSFKINFNNILSMLYSQNKVRKLLEEYIKNTNTYYDFVIMSRFDFLNLPTINLKILDNNKLYFTFSGHRIILLPFFSIMNPYNFNKFYRIFDNLPKLLDNEYIENTMKEFNEVFCVNAEELIIINAIYEFNINKENINSLIVFTNLIPNFINF